MCGLTSFYWFSETNGENRGQIFVYVNFRARVVEMRNLVPKSDFYLHQFLQGLRCALLVLNVIAASVCDELPKFTSCNDVIDLESRNINQGVLQLTIRSGQETSDMRVSCDFTIKAGPGKHVMFYFTDMYLGSPNRTERLDKACIEPRDVTGHYESVPTGMRPIICSQTEVEIGNRVYATTGNALSLRFYRNRGYSIKVYFTLVFTAFRLGSCRTSERKCNNERCIPHDIVCNGNNPCGDHSDCPTGLEHLSSWAMSGIVVLGLLAGGIVIIMATVCIQRASGKRYDFDDILSPANGTLHCDNQRVEMKEVQNESSQPGSDFSNRRRMKETDVTLYKTGKPKQVDITVSKSDQFYFKEFQRSLLELPTNNDREKLLHSQRSSSENNSDESLPAKKEESFDSFVDPKQTSEGNEDMVAQIIDISRNSGDTLTDNFKLQENESSKFSSNYLLPVNEFSLSTETFDATKPFQDDTLSRSSKIGLQEPLRLSGNSLVFSDSDSCNEEEPFHRYDPAPSHLKPSSSLNGYIVNGSNEIFGDFKPPPPPYGACKATVLS